jgi:hypothetical protein
VAGLYEHGRQLVNPGWCRYIGDIGTTCFLSGLVMLFFSWRWSGSSTQAWMPTYVSTLRIPQMIWVWRMSVKWYIDRGKPENSEKNNPSATLSTTNPTWIGPGANPGLRGERPATNDLSHGTALRCCYWVLSHTVSHTVRPLMISYASLSDFLSFLMHPPETSGSN